MTFPPTHFLISAVISSFGISTAFASLQPAKVYVAETHKTKVYISDGMVVGGDRAITDVTVKDIRRAANSGFDRLVIDLEGNRLGEPVAIPRPPYFQVAVGGVDDRLTFTIWGHPKLSFDPKKVLASLQKSPLLGKVELYPRLEDNSWTFVVGMKPGKTVEVFELTHPVRIIVDIKPDKRDSRS